MVQMVLMVPMVPMVQMALTAQMAQMVLMVQMVQMVHLVQMVQTAHLALLIHLVLGDWILDSESHMVGGEVDKNPHPILLSCHSCQVGTSPRLVQLYIASCECMSSSSLSHLNIQIYLTSSRPKWSTLMLDQGGKGCREQSPHL